MPDDKHQPQDWRVLAERVISEEDSSKLTEIVEELCRSLDEPKTTRSTPTP
jgi:hypothetical protein